MKTKQADMLEWFQKWCQDKLFCNLCSASLTKFFNGNSTTYCPFSRFKKSAHQLNYSLVFPTDVVNGTVDDQRKHLSRLSSKCIVTIEVTVDRLNYHSSSSTVSEIQQKSKRKVQQSTSAVLNLTYRFHLRLAKHTTKKKQIGKYTFGNKQAAQTYDCHPATASVLAS